jgi:hypothetical protein
MKSLMMAAVLLVQAIILLGTCPASTEAVSSQQSQPSVTIKQMPSIDVKRDWMDCASLTVGILLVIVGAATGGLIWYQARKTAEATEAMRDSIRLQEIGMQQWVAVVNWRAEAGEVGSEEPEAGIRHFRARIKADLINQTNFPLTLTQSGITFSKMGKNDGSWTHFPIRDGFFLTPHIPHLIEVSVEITGEQYIAFHSNGFGTAVNGQFTHTGALGKTVTQTLKGFLVLTALDTRFEPEVPMHPQDSET